MWIPMANSTNDNPTKIKTPKKIENYWIKEARLNCITSKSDSKLGHQTINDFIFNFLFSTWTTKTNQLIKFITNSFKNSHWWFAQFKTLCSLLKLIFFFFKEKLYDCMRTIHLHSFWTRFFLCFFTWVFKSLRGKLAIEIQIKIKCSSNENSAEWRKQIKKVKSKKSRALKRKKKKKNGCRFGKE